MILNKDKQKQVSLSKILCLLQLLMMFTPLSLAEEWETAGHLKYYFSHTNYEQNNIFALAGESSPTDHSLDLRLTAKKKWLKKWDTVIHYEAAAYDSDSIKVVRSLAPYSSIAAYGLPNDDARLFNLTSMVNNDATNVLFHRLDRASIGYTSDNLVIRFGRQAVSWGNGLVFQPMDIFNPFSPNAIDKEYKTGDDMLYLQSLLESGDDLQMVLIPRRNQSTNDIKKNESSLAVKYHSTLGDTDMDVLLSRHFGNNLVGIGFATDWKGAIIRGDLVNVWNSLDTRLSTVVSINYSWVFSDLNFSGFIEYYHNGDGISNENYNPINLANKPELLRQISRGEKFTLARDYLSAGLTVELTPRWLFTPLLINNNNDGSRLTQWIINFDWKENLTLLMGANLPFGKKGTEYGGLPGSLPDVYSGGGRSIFLQLAIYF